MSVMLNICCTKARAIHGNWRRPGLQCESTCIYKDAQHPIMDAEDASSSTSSIKACR